MSLVAVPASAGPLVSILLLACRQPATVGEAIAGALAQTYSPLEIVVSDDASGEDGTWKAITEAVSGYAGPHRLLLNRNPRNLGIGGHIDRLVGLSHGELIVIAAGDDVSLPQRCERVVAAWLAADRCPDLIAASLIDIDAAGGRHGTIVPTDLSGYRNAADWVARPPHVVGAAQAWTRRVYERFGPLPPGTVAEDRLMVFRAIVGGGAITIAEPLVLYRRGGISRRRRALSADDVIQRLLRNNRHARVELPQLLADAARAGQLRAVEPTLMRELERERFIDELFGATTAPQRWRAVRRATGLPWSWRLRLWVYAGFPKLLTPFFLARRLLGRDS